MNFFKGDLGDLDLCSGELASLFLMESLPTFNTGGKFLNLKLVFTNASLSLEDIFSELSIDYV
jgi:hypothetical protein